MRATIQPVLVGVMSFGQPRYVPEEWVRVRCRSRMGTERSGGSCKRVPFQNLSSVKRLSAHVRAAEKGAGTPTRVSVVGHHVVVCKLLLMFISSSSTHHVHHGVGHRAAHRTAAKERQLQQWPHLSTSKAHARSLARRSHLFKPDETRDTETHSRWKALRVS